MPKESKKLSKKKSRQIIGPKITIFGFIAVLLTLGVYLAYTTFRPEPLRIAEIGNPTGLISLELKTGSTQLAVDQESTLSIDYDSGSHVFLAVHAEITYDPTLLDVTNIALNNKFTMPIIAGKAEGGKIIFAYGSGVDGSGPTGKGNLATMKIRAKKTGSTTLSFNAATTTLVFNTTTTNDLKSVNSLTISVPAPSVAASLPASANPSVTPSADPSVDPSANPSVIPSTPASANPSVTPSISPSAPAELPKLAAPANLKYNCYSNGARITLRWDSVSGATSYTSTLKKNSDGSTKDQSESKTEIDTDISPATNYTWQLVAKSNNHQNSSASTVENINCQTTQGGSTASPSPSPTIKAQATPTPTPKSNPVVNALKAIIPTKKPTPTPSIAPAVAETPVIVPNTPTPTPGRLGDIFSSPIANESSQETGSQPGLLSKIWQGWKTLFYRLYESLGR